MFGSKSVIGKAEDAIYPVDKAVGFLSAYQMDRDLSSW